MNNDVLQSEIDSIIKAALDENKNSKASSPPPPLETVSADKQFELKQKLKQLSSITQPMIYSQATNNENDEQSQHNNTTKDDDPKYRKPHKHRTNITWDDCHEFQSECHICHVYINEYEKYCQHLKAKHYDIDDDLEWLTCDVCGKMNAHKSNFISHLASHTGRKPFKCRIVLSSGEYCVTEASTRQNLQTHILKVHKMSVKHKLQSKSRKTTHSDPEKKRKRKKKKKV